MSSDGLPHQVGGFDPLLDDSVDFNTRIRRLGVPGEMRIHRTLPHTFLSFPHWLHTVPEVRLIASDCV
jgi:acetyl esterase/lipase